MLILNDTSQCAEGGEPPSAVERLPPFFVVDLPCCVYEAGVWICGWPEADDVFALSCKPQTLGDIAFWVLDGDLAAQVGLDGELDDNDVDRSQPERRNDLEEDNKDNLPDGDVGDLLFADEEDAPEASDDDYCYSVECYTCQEAWSKVECPWAGALMWGEQDFEGASKIRWQAIRCDDGTVRQDVEWERDESQDECKERHADTGLFGESECPLGVLDCLCADKDDRADGDHNGVRKYKVCALPESVIAFQAVDTFHCAKQAGELGSDTRVSLIPLMYTRILRVIESYCPRVVVCSQADECTR